MVDSVKVRLLKLVRTGRITEVPKLGFGLFLKRKDISIRRMLM